jgi:hypothetical protein
MNHDASFGGGVLYSSMMNASGVIQVMVLLLSSFCFVEGKRQADHP